MFGFIDLYGTSLDNLTPNQLEPVREETSGQEIARCNWLSAEEHRRFVHRLQLRPTSAVLDVASGSGGPGIYLAEAVGCEVVGIDIDSQALALAEAEAHQRGFGRQVSFLRADAGRPLPFADWRFDAVLCIDAVVHLPDRLRALREWRRVIRPGGRILYTDPAVVTGLVTRDELADRGAQNAFQFSSPGVNERLIQGAGLELEEAIDVTDNAVRLSKRWQDARSRCRDELIEREGKESFERLQRHLAAVHQLGSQRRLSRFVYVAHKPVPAGCEL